MTKKYLVVADGEFSCRHPANAVMPPAGSEKALCAYCSHLAECQEQKAKRLVKMRPRYRLIKQ